LAAPGRELTYKLIFKHYKKNTMTDLEILKMRKRNLLNDKKNFGEAIAAIHRQLAWIDEQLLLIEQEQLQIKFPELEVSDTTK
jgi:hypothetical protein